MLAKIAPRFVISRVIQNSYYAQYMSVQLLKYPFGQYIDPLFIEDSKKFFQCKFYSFIAAQTKPNSFTCRYEEETYNNACESLNSFRNIYEIVHNISEFAKEIQLLYRVVEKDQTSSNFLNKHTQTNQNYEADVLDALARYNKFLKQLEGKDEWLSKLKEEVGKWFHLIHNCMNQSQAKRNLFSKLNRQEYFV